jgi:hypothetical protein
MKLQVHRSMLVKDKSTFDSMFSLESYTQNTELEETLASGNSEGESDENPIRLLGDRAEEFSALMWSLYSLCASSQLSLFRYLLPPKGRRR